MTLQEEQAAFDAQLPEMLKQHKGQFVLFKDAKPVEYFSDHAVAYRTGLERFGVEAVFLVAPVEVQRQMPVSFAWQAGVMFS